MDKQLFAVWSKWTKRICWLFYAENSKEVSKHMSGCVPYFSTMKRFSIIPQEYIGMDQLKEFITHSYGKDFAYIVELSNTGKEIGKKKISITSK